ncbi:MAG: hypothetical protein ACRENU_14120, partial [Gemmatimonadaceae bacterium]
MIAAGLADALVGCLRLDFAFVRLRDPVGRTTLEVTRGSASTAFPAWLDQIVRGDEDRWSAIHDLSCHGTRYSGLALPIGLGAEGGLLAVACSRA